MKIKAGGVLWTVEELRDLWVAAGGSLRHGSLEALPRVPWEGGPAYYASFPQAVASGMTDPAFFPIAVDFESVTSQGNIDTDKAYGANMYVRLTSDSDLALIRSNGMVTLHQTDTTATPGNETVGWTASDELDVSGPQGWATGATFDNLHAEWQVVESFAGADGRMRYTNYSKPVAFNEADALCRVYVNGTDTASPARLPGATDGRAFSFDMTSLDVYYYTLFLSRFDKNNLNALGCPDSLIRRAINYGKYGVNRIRVRQAMESPPNYQPVYTFVEVVNQMTGAETAAEGIPVTDPTDAQIAGAVWGSLIYEARGIIYFVHDFNHSGSFHNLRDNINNRTPGVTALNAQVKRLAPVLNTQSYVWEFDSTVKTMLKSHGGFAYIFAMSHAQDPHDTTARTFTLPAGMPSHGTAEVVDEARTIPVSGSAFSDSFAAESSYHIYKIEL